MSILSRVRVWPLRLKFRDGPYAMSHVVQEFIEGRIISIETSDGNIGIGETVVPPSALESELRQMRDEEPDTLRRLIGKPVDAVFELSAGSLRETKARRGFAFGLETATLDLKSRREDRSLTDSLGGRSAPCIPDYFSISEKSDEAIRRRVETAGPNRKVIQLKIGIGSLDDDIGHVRAALDAMSSTQLLLADFNGGRSVADAITVAGCIEDPRIVWEEPCRTYEENAEVARAVTAPVMMDQCVGDLEVFKRAARDGLAHSLCVKPAFMGGLIAAREARDLAIANGVAIRVDGPWCGDIATAAIAALAIGVPKDLLVAGCDLREPLVMAPSLGGVINDGSGWIEPPPGPGLGIDPECLAVLGEPDVVYPDTVYD